MKCACVNEQACLRRVSSDKYIWTGTVKHLPLTLNSHSFLLRSTKMSYFKFGRIPAFFFSVTSSLCCVFLHTLQSPLMGILLLSLWSSHRFCCSTSVKSEADVHRIKHNALIINSCLHQRRHIDRGLAQQVAYFISHSQSSLSKEVFSRHSVSRALSFICGVHVEITQPSSMCLLFKPQQAE